MRLENIFIKSFRSIVDKTVCFNHNFTVIVGMNEAGKTNILDAVRTLGASYQLQLKDTPKMSNTPPEIIFSFRLTDSNAEALQKSIEEVFKKAMPQIADLSSIRFPSIEKSKIECSVYLKSNGEMASRFSVCLDDGDEQTGLLLLHGDPAPPDTETLRIGELEIPLSSCQYAPQDLLTDSQETFFRVLDAQELVSTAVLGIDSVLREMVPKVIYWTYEDKFLMPPEITYDQLLTDVQEERTSVPLYNLLTICPTLNIDETNDLMTKIQGWKTDSSSRRRDEGRINDAVNKYLKSIWREYDQEFKITLEETKITVHICHSATGDRNFYEMSERSQGFKTFVSFLLTTAANVHTNKVSNFVIVLDEPETHLHPSGVRFMREELLKLAGQNNNVICATHSIFMVDRKMLERHLMVSKFGEDTNIQACDKNTITQESVIYEALGTSIDEFGIPRKNIIFEGKMDLMLFEAYVDLCIDGRSNPFKDYRFLDGGGTKGIKRFFTEKKLLSEREWIIVLDNDKPAGNLVETLKGVADLDFANSVKIIRYSEENGHELEDILPREFLLTSLKATTSSFDVELEDGDLPGRAPFMVELKDFAAKKCTDNVDRLQKCFKERTIEAIAGEVANIGRSSCIPEKKEAFRKVFPDYFEFASTFHQNISAKEASQQANDGSKVQSVMS